MILDQFTKTILVQDGCIDWVSTDPLGPLGSPEITFHRGQIKRSTWKEGLPLISLHKIKLFDPVSRCWRKTNSKTSNFFDFYKLKEKEIHFASESNQNGIIRFMIFFGIQGFVLPRSAMPQDHYFIVTTRKPNSRKTAPQS